MPRKIVYGSRTFDDPGPEFNADEIRDFLSTQLGYPELATAESVVDKDTGDITYVVRSQSKG